jgi:hypothetical protein
MSFEDEEIQLEIDEEMGGVEGVKDKLQKKTKKFRDGLSYYGETFRGFQLKKEWEETLPSYRDFYMDAKTLDPNANNKAIVRQFNEEICVPSGVRFHPNLSQLWIFNKKWDYELSKERETPGLAVQRKEIAQFIKTKTELGEHLPPADNSLEAGVRTLGGELLNDAFQMLKDDQELGDIYDNETLIKRRNYVVGVFGHVTKMVQGKAALMLKASQEKRENAGFLMDILSKATSGTLTEEDMTLLKSAYAQQPNEQINSQ